MKFRALVAFVLAVFWSVMSYAQDPPQPPQKPLARISGRVVAADSGKPIRWAVVRAASPQGRQLYTVTDEQGRFELKELIAGTYRLDVRAERYLPIQFGGFPYDGRAAVPKPIDLKADEHFDRADFALPRGAAIEGRVLDEFGDPAPGITVQVSRLEYVVGRRRLIPVGGRTRMQPTDDRGHFRVFGLQAGDYYLSALSGVFTDQNESAGFVPTYYPGTSDAASAQRIRLGYGAELVDVVLQLIPAKMARIGGRLVDANGHPVSPGMVLLTVNDRLRISDFFFTRVVTGPDGTFAFRNVPPGSYTLQGFGRQVTSAGNLRASEFGCLPIVADGVDIADLVLAVRAGASLRGRVVLEPSDGPPLRPYDVSVGAGPVGFDSAPLAGGPAPGGMKNDWTFEVSNLFGTQQIMAGTRNPAWSLKRITRNGVDITEVPVDFTKGDVEDVEITLTSRGPALTGGVADGQGKPTPDYSVVLFAADPAKWTGRSRYVWMARPAQGGGFTLRGMPPESYLVVALPTVTGNEWQDPDVLETLRALATPVTLSEGDAKTIELRLQQRN